MALILTAAYLCLNAGIAGRKLVEPRADIFQNARVAMALLTADLRNACPLSKDYAFLGMKRMIGAAEADNLDFATHNHTPRHQGEGDYCEESYYLDQDPATGRFSLWRRRNPRLAPDPLSGGSREEIVRGLMGARFEYFDGEEWYDNWGEIEGRAKAENSNRDHPNLEGMPEAVRITLVFDSDARTKRPAPANRNESGAPMVFQTVVRLELADVAQDTSAGAPAPAGSAGQPGGGNQ